MIVLEPSLGDLRPGDLVTTDKFRIELFTLDSGSRNGVLINKECSYLLRGQLALVVSSRMGKRAIRRNKDTGDVEFQDRVHVMLMTPRGLKWCQEPLVRLNDCTFGE